ncbi:MAG: DNA methyltransferase [Candidatus Nitrotoga sp.]
MSAFNFPLFHKHLSAFAFTPLFTEVLGWNQPPRGERDWRSAKVKDLPYRSRMVAELAGIAVLEIAAEGGWPDEAQRMAIWRKISEAHHENLLIFLDHPEQRSQSLWYWVKRVKDGETGKAKNIPRRHEYFRGQPVDLFASKLQAMVVELSELDETGRIPVLEVARRMESALDMEKTTKRFFTAYQEQHGNLLAEIEGIDDERDRRWYASVILNRLMFVWFMQKKGFLDNADYDYLPKQFAASQARGQDRFFGEFLNALFFEAFAKPKGDRAPAVQALTGEIPYLNGGLFLHHPLELDNNKQPRLGITLNIPDSAFAGVFNLFAAYSWNLDDTPGGEADEINPDVLGYIFEKYINQKAFGAYYTRPEITNYLAERSIHKLILEHVNAPAVPELNLKEISFTSVPDMLAKMDNPTALKLVQKILPSINVLDPAVGSGAFLVAALKVLINIYSAVVGRAELGASDALQFWLKTIQQEHPSVAYYIKRCIVTDNLYGVDIMQEATEIAKLRLFLTMVASVRKVEELEPLPNIDFNILPGNSLVGLMRVDEHEFDKINSQGDLFKTSYRQLLEEKNRDLETYRHTADLMGRDVNLQYLRNKIDTKLTEATGTLNELLRDQFESLGVKYEQATWDAVNSALGKPKKIKVERVHIDEQTPFHWGYMFDQIMQKQGGFDIILANPPWEVFKPQAKEFFAEHSELVTKNKMTIKEFEKEQDELLKNKAVRAAWLDYESRFPHISAYFRAASEYSFQSAVINGKKTGSDLNLYKLFVERCFNLLRPGGHCGIVIPSGIYTDLGAKGLRDLLFNHSCIEGLFCFENRKAIFEGVDSRFKFVVLTFEKTAMPRLQETGERNASAPPDDLLAPTGGTTSFPAAFMRHDVAELDRFPDQGALWLDVGLIRKLSPDSHSVMEFKSDLDVFIAQKMLTLPMLGEHIDGAWNLVLTNEFHMTNDSHMFKTEPGKGRLPLYEGKMIWQFDSCYSKPKYWLDEGEAGKSLSKEQKLSGFHYSDYRVAFREIASNTNERSLVASILPKKVFANHKLMIERRDAPLSAKDQLVVVAILNSFVFDSIVRNRVTTSISMYAFYQMPAPRVSGVDKKANGLVSRAARLICTTPEFDDLAKEVGLKRHQPLEPIERARLRAELDGLIAHLYGLTEAEFAHILTTFPLVAEPVKVAALNAYRDVERGLVK